MSNAELGTGSRRDLLTSPEIQAAGDLAYVYDALERLRRDYLRVRVIQNGRAVYAAPAVRVNDADNGGIESLRTMPVAMVEDIRLVHPVEARQRYGIAYPTGVLLVRTRR